ncbi:permease [Desulfurobacterium sp.]|uniref:permease n=1 Tax=Desulfurobacterium sp. TaxID=2004706 RepID=UPI002633A476|nr:permease [Desulfurobacterium sp.]
MKNNSEEKKKLRQDIIAMLLTIAVTAVLLFFFPSKRDTVILTSWQFFVEMISILPAVMILMGLFAVFVPKDLIVKHLGETAGPKAILLGILLGTLPTGPLYVAFPMAAVLLKKGARVSCIVAFLSAWACIKIPQEMVELQFLGFKFMIVRLTLTVLFVVIMSLIIEKLAGKEKIKPADFTAGH